MILNGSRTDPNCNIAIPEHTGVHRPERKTKTQTLRWPWSTQWGLTYNTPMILLAFP
jgi:hypothetical protein